MFRFRESEPRGKRAYIARIITSKIGRQRDGIMYVCMAHAKNIMKSILASFLLLLSTTHLLAQDTVRPLELTFEKSIDLLADTFYGVDEVGTLFYERNNVFYKKTASQTLQFYDILLGELTSVDIINPMNAMLFYRETQTVVFLDNRLNETRRVVLSALEPYRFIQYAGVAGEQQLWLFNMDEQRLERYDYVNKRQLPFLKSVSLPVTGLVSTYNFCHLKTAQQLFTFNSYGSLTGTIDKEKILGITASFKQLLVWSSGEFAVWQQGKNAVFSLAYTTTQLPEALQNDYNPKNSLYLKAGKLYLYNGNRISVYQTNLLN